MQYNFSGAVKAKESGNALTAGIRMQHLWV